MFREMRRFAQQLSDEECQKVLREAKHGVLSVLGDDGYPYGVTLSHWYCEEDGHLYFHGAGTGHKNDAIAACDKVSFCVIDDGYREGDDWVVHYNSVVVFGRICVVTDEAEKVRICTGLTRKFTDDEEYLARDLAKYLAQVNCLELVPEHITGKRVKES